MRRLVSVLVVVAAALATAPAALAATYVVNDAGAAFDATAVNDCTTSQPGCTLPAAITASNTSVGVADTITFTGAGTAPGPFTTPLPQVTDPVTIDGGGNTTVSFGPAATGMLLDIAAGNTLVRAITFTGGGSGVVVNMGGSSDRLDTVTVQNTAATAMRMGADGQRVDGSRVQSASGTGVLVNGSNGTVGSSTISATGGDGIAVTGGGTTVSSPDISGAGGDGINFSGSGNSASGGRIHGNSRNGVEVSGQADTVSHVVFFGNGGKPIANQPGANGGIAPPQNLRVGPRRTDGSLVLTGSSGSGTIEMWSGDPSSGSAPTFFDSFSAGGDFTYTFSSDPQPGSVLALSLTAAGVGSSEFATVSVPQDITSPDVRFARAVDTQNVRIDFTEPLNPSSVQASDFALNMAGVDRKIAAMTVSPDGTFVTLTSSGWKAGEAGYVTVNGTAGITDTSGNAMQSAPRMRVAAAPGDFIAPIGGKLAVIPKTICLTHARSCPRPGMKIRFTSTEAGKATLVIKRSNVTVGKRLYSSIVAGLNTVNFNGRLGARKLRAGRYRLLMYVQDRVGNVTTNPPIVLFNVRRVSP